MPFVEIAVPPSPSATKVAPFKIAVKTAAKPNPRKNPELAGLLNLRVLIGAEAFKQLGWQATDTIKVRWGTGVDHNKIRLSLDPEGRGYNMRVGKAGHATVTVNHLPDVFSGKDFPEEEVVFYPNDGIVTIELPEGFLTNKPVKGL